MKNFYFHFLNTTIRSPNVSVNVKAVDFKLKTRKKQSISKISRRMCNKIKILDLLDIVRTYINTQRFRSLVF